MPSMNSLLRSLFGSSRSVRNDSRRPDFRARLALSSLEQLEERATPAVSPLSLFAAFQARVVAAVQQNNALEARSDELAAMTPTQTFNNVRSPLTITGNGGVNVIRIRGDITAPITLNGTASDVFYVNVRGDMRLNGTESLLLAGGVTASHVLYNFYGNPGNLQVRNGVINGTVLAPKYNVVLNGTTLNGELFTTPWRTTVRGGAVLNPVPFTLPTTPPAPSVANGTLTGRTYSSSGEPYGGMEVTLTGTDAQGNAVFLTTNSDDLTGEFSFTGLAAGTYTLTFAGSPFGGSATPGTVDAGNSGSVLNDLTIENIVLTGDSVGVGYDFIIPAIE